MTRLRELFSGEDRAVSPVIGVILMVAITVILAAVIASFVLGLGDSAAEPAPNPTISSDHSADELELSVTGGDDFDASAAEIQFEIFVNETGASNNATIDDTVGLDTAGNTFENESSDDALNVTIDTGEEVTAGDTITFEPAGDYDEIEEWDVDIVWNPADADSEIIYSDSS